VNYLVLLGYVVALLLCAAHIKGLMITGIIEYSWGTVSVPGPLYKYHITFCILSALLGLWLCTRTLRSDCEPAVRLRAKYWIVAVVVFVPLALTNFLVNYGLPIVPPGSLGNIGFVCLLAYAAVRHRLMDIDVFIMRTAATLLASIAVALPLAMAVIWGYHLPFGASSVLVIGAMLLAATVSLIAFSGFRAYLEQQVESSLFPSRHAAREAIRRLSADLVKLPPDDDLQRRFTQTLIDGLGVSGVALYLRSAEPEVYELVKAAGTINAPPQVTDYPLSRFVDHESTIVVAPPPHRGQLSTIERLLGKFQWEVYVPIRANGSIFGFLALGAKTSGAAIDDSDTTLLAMLAAQFGVALKNGEYVLQIQRQAARIEELQKRVEAENVVLRAEVREGSQFKEIIGSSVALQRVLSLVEKVAPTPASVLITGETGTGKELIARALHEASPRRTGPLINVNCPAIPAGLAESELFGHERGAFTDAFQAKPGKFELADGGTIFLDEIAELSVELQVKLLRVLQEHETQRVGGRRVHKLDLRVVAATNRDLEAEIRAGRFRKDLYYRLAAVVVDVPPLRARAGDIPVLARFFLERAARTYQKAITGFAPDAMTALCRYNWPGNIRELEHVVERAALLCSGDVIRPEHLSDLAVAAEQDGGPQLLRSAVREEKLRRVAAALAQTGGNRAAAARLLGMSASNLSRLIKNLGLKDPPSVQ